LFLAFCKVRTVRHRAEPRTVPTVLFDAVDETRGMPGSISQRMRHSLPRRRGGNVTAPVAIIPKANAKHLPTTASSGRVVDQIGRPRKPDVRTLWISHQDKTRLAICDLRWSLGRKGRGPRTTSVQSHTSPDTVRVPAIEQCASSSPARHSSKVGAVCVDAPVRFCAGGNQ